MGMPCKKYSVSSSAMFHHSPRSEGSGPSESVAGGGGGGGGG